MQIDVVCLEGCPNTQIMLERLGDVLNRTGWNGVIMMLDAEVLAREGDVRTGYGAPTILVDGKDLFGAPLPDHRGLVCRIYWPKLPTVQEIEQRLDERIRGLR
jgi:hypothetical protein